jgi:multimeric flavodoxin WrbA
VYDEILKEDNIVFASPMYISNINGILKNLVDRFNTFYNHKLLKGKKIYLVMSGFATKEDNIEEINGIINYFNGITEYMLFDFEFLDYFVDSTDPKVIEENNNKINIIKEKLK